MKTKRKESVNDECGNPKSKREAAVHEIKPKCARFCFCFSSQRMKCSWRAYEARERLCRVVIDIAKKTLARLVVISNILPLAGPPSGLVPALLLVVAAEMFVGLLGFRNGIGSGCGITQQRTSLLVVHRCCCVIARRSRCYHRLGISFRVFAQALVCWVVAAAHTRAAGRSSQRNVVVRPTSSSVVVVPFLRLHHGGLGLGRFEESLVLGFR